MPAKAVWIVVGDVHENLTRLPDIPELAEASGVVVNGDFTNYGGPGKLAGIYGALAERCPRVLGHVGNLDRPECQDWLETRGVNIHARAVELAPGVCAMGLGGSTPTPARTPTEYPEEAYEGWLKDLARQAEGFRHAVLVSHNPPKDCSCDRIASGLHVGSQAVRDFIEAHAPEICICGHIHEARGEDRIGSTRIINPGAFKDGGYVVLSLASDGSLEAELKFAAG
jgi:Icc-related predicted phosphoesterase